MNAIAFFFGSTWLGLAWNFKFEIRNWEFGIGIQIQFQIHNVCTRCTYAKSILYPQVYSRLAHIRVHQLLRQYVC